jgi:hypothetical protein
MNRDFDIGCATIVYTSVIIGLAFLRVIVCGALLKSPKLSHFWDSLLIDKRCPVTPVSVWQLLLVVMCVWALGIFWCV